MNKPFDHEYGIKVTKELSKLKIRTQACFIAGCPGETKKDRDLTIKYVIQLVKSGVDEIAVFIYSTIPGSNFADQISGFKHFSELTRSPSWRSDYGEIKRFRTRMYLTFIVYKTIFHPRKVIRSVGSVVRRKYETKMEMSIVKYFKFRLLRWAPFLY